MEQGSLRSHLTMRRGPRTDWTVRYAIRHRQFRQQTCELGIHSLPIVRSLHQMGSPCAGCCYSFVLRGAAFAAHLSMTNSNKIRVPSRRRSFPRRTRRRDQHRFLRRIRSKSARAASAFALPPSLGELRRTSRASADCVHLRSSSFGGLCPPPLKLRRTRRSDGIGSVR